MKKVAFHNLGCKVNSYELEFVQQKFKENDFLIVSFDQKADIYVINTCTVTNIADRKSRQMLHKAKGLNSDAVVVAMGCYAQTSTEKALEDDSIDIVIGNAEKGKAFDIILDFINKRHPNEKNQISDISEVSEYDEYTLTSTQEHTRVYIKIQDGCNQFCSYCAIPLARGRIRSRKIEDIVNEVSELTKRGYKEFVLTGIHLSSYGMENYNQEVNKQRVELTDFSNNTMLIDAIESVAKIEGVERIRLGSLEPRIITNSFLERLSSIKQICPHFHLSLQSGSDAVLKRMNRQYNTKEFSEKAELIRQYFDHPGITTDVIAGFPGETQEEFLETKNYLNEIDFYEAHIFKYSRRRGTVADKMPLQLTEKEKSERSEVLIKDSEKRSRLFREHYLGKTLEALLEEPVEIHGERYMVGYTREYVRVACKADESLANTIIFGQAKRMLTDEIVEVEMAENLEK